jgi:sulfate adenylyltransferase
MDKAARNRAGNGGQWLAPVGRLLGYGGAASPAGGIGGLPFGRAASSSVGGAYGGGPASMRGAPGLLRPICSLCFVVSCFMIVAWHTFVGRTASPSSSSSSSSSPDGGSPHALAAGLKWSQQEQLAAIAMQGGRAAEALAQPQSLYYLEGTPSVAVPHGGRLVDLLLPVGSPRRDQLEAAAAAAMTTASAAASAASSSTLSSALLAAGGIKIAATWTLTQRQLCDIELLLNGGFSPLTGFMGRTTYEAVVKHSRLAPPPEGLEDATAAANLPATAAPGESYPPLLWPMPITLDLPAAVAEPLKLGDKVALRDEYFNLVAVLTVGPSAQSAKTASVDIRDWVYRPDKTAEAASVFGTTDPSHPGVGYLVDKAGEYYVGGALEGLNLPQHFDFAPLRRTPKQVRDEIQARGWARTVAFQTRNPMHRAHIELTRLAGAQAKAGVLLHPVVGMTKPGDIDYSVRVRCYAAVLASKAGYYPPGGVMLSLLPLAMRMAGPKEAFWHAIIRKNFGASHFVVGRDHAGCKDSKNKDFYGAYDAQTLLFSHAQELGITPLAFQEVEYVPSLESFFPADKVPLADDGKKVFTQSISGTQFRGLMNAGKDVPAWYSDPGVISILRDLMPPTHKRGFALFFTGLSGGGKTTISHGLITRLASLLPTRKITVLDGDVVRTHLSRGLGFSIQDRNANVERIGYVAAEAVRHGGIVIAAPIAPFEAGRATARRLVEAAGGGFLLIHTATSLAECAVRDVKGLYAGAGYGTVDKRTGAVDMDAVKYDLTGISHPYELPPNPDLVIPTQDVPVADAVTSIIAILIAKGYIREDEGVTPAGGVASAGAGIGSTSAAADAYSAGASDVTAHERALAASIRAAAGSKKGDAAAAAAIAAPAPGFLPRAVEAVGVSVMFPPPSGVDVIGRQCSARWDGFDLPAVTAGALHGGMPMKGTVTARAAAASAGAGGGGVSIRPDAPPASVVVGVAASAEAVPALKAALAQLFPPTGPTGAVVGTLAPQRAAAILAAAAEATGAGGKGGGATGADAAAAVPSLFSEDPQVAAAAAAAGGAGVSLATTVAVTAPKAGAGAGSAALAEPTRLHAAYDLWTALRWRPAVLPTAGAATLPPPALVAAATSSASLPLSILAPLLRLDPCLRVAVVVTEGEAGEADALAHTFPSRVAVVKVAAGESAAAGGIAAALRGNAVWSATSA